MSRSLVGSSSSRTLGSLISSRISCSRRRSPPLRSLHQRAALLAAEPEALAQHPRGQLGPSPSRARPLDRLDRLEHAQLARDLGRVLREERELDRRAARDLTRRRLQLTREQLHQRRLAGAVDADDRDAVAGPEPPGRVAQQHLLAERDRHALGVEHLVAEPRAREAQQLGAVARLGLVGDQRVGGLDPELRLRGARRRAAPQPGELLAQQLLAALLARGGLPRPLGTREHVRRVAALVLVHGGVRDLPRERADGVQEPAVVGDDEHRAAARGEMAREPVDALDVEVVRRLVEQQQLGVVEQRLGQRDPAPLAARERRDPSCPARSGSARSPRRRAARRARCGTSRRRCHSWSARPPTSSSRIVRDGIEIVALAEQRHVQPARARDRARVRLPRRPRSAAAASTCRRRCGRRRRSGRRPRRRA